MNRIPVLFVTSYFPPTGHIAAFRMHAYAKYFNKDKYKVFVVTKNWGEGDDRVVDFEGCEVHYLKASSLMTDLTLYRAKNKLQHYLTAIKNKLIFNFFTDESPDFSAKALTRASKIIQENSIKVILTSFGPLSSIVIGLRIKKKFPNILWVSDLRDEVAMAPKVSRFLRPKVRRIEKRMMECADLVVSVSAPILAELIDRDKYEYKCLEVRNGFDFIPEKTALPKGDIFRVVYAGSFYGVIQPHNFFKALGLFLQRNPGVKISVDIYGGNAGLSIPTSIARVIHVSARTSHDEIVRILQNASALLMIYPTDERRGVYTGKLFDYLAINRPILALVNPEDVAAQLIEEANAGYICDNSDINGIVKLLEDAYAQWQKETVPQRKWDVVLRHHRSNQVKYLTDRVEAMLAREKY